MPFSPSVSVPEWLQSKLDLLSMSQEVTLVGSWELVEGSEEVLWSNEMFRIFEIPKIEGNYVNRSVFYNYVHPDDAPQVRESVNKLRKMELFEIDYRIITPDQKIKFIHAWYRRVSIEEGRMILRGTIQDVTKQRELENNLRKLNSELLLQNTTFQQAEMIGASGHWQYNVRSGKCFFSSNVFRLLDLKENAFDSLEQFVAYIDNKDRKIVSDLFLTPQKEFNTSFKIKTGSGTELFLKCNGRLIHDLNGEETYIGILFDITKEEVLRQELNKRTAFAEQLITLSTESITVFDQEERILEWNPATEKLFGVKKEDIAGRIITEVFPNLKESERHKLVRRTLNGETIDAIKSEFSVKKGYGDAYYRPLLNEAGEVYAALLMIYDTTEEVHLQQSLEERTKIAETVIDSIQNMISVFDKDLNIIHINREVEKRHKEKREHVLGKNVLEAYPFLKGTERLNDLHKALNGESLFYENIPYLDGKGYHNNMILPLKDHKGDIFGVLAVSHDITAMKKAEVELRRLNEELEIKNLELEKKNEELSSFTYMASHDLQEPLRKIQLFGDKVIEKESNALSESGKDYLRRMISSTERMQNLINDLLTFSRIGNHTPEFGPVDLNQSLFGVKTILKERLEELNATISLSNLPTISGIHFQINQLFENIISNSLKYHHPEKAPVITIACTTINGINEELLNSSAPFYKITIADNGIGFDPQFSEHIFGLFHRLHGRSEYPGTGLGLSICKRIVEIHGGTIKASGVPDNGSVFTIYLPVVE